MELSMKMFLGVLVVMFLAPVAHAETLVCDYGDYYLTIDASKGAAKVNYVICEFHQCLDNLMSTRDLVRSTGSDDTYDISANGHVREELVVSYESSGMMSGAVVRNSGYNIQFFNDCRPIR
jgi:hypothetical protein